MTTENFDDLDPKSPETSPRWHTPILTCFDVGNAETGGIVATDDASITGNS
jgi:hypothetical protein